jgi:hypothetical protein
VEVGRRSNFRLVRVFSERIIDTGFWILCNIDVVLIDEYAVGELRLTNS